MEGRTVAPIRVDDAHLGVWLGVVRDEGRRAATHIALVEQVAAEEMPSDAA